MKKYHITWFDSIEDYHSKGETFEAHHVHEALLMFDRKYPDAVFLSCVSSEVLELKVRQG